MKKWIIVFTAVVFCAGAVFYLFSNSHPQDQNVYQRRVITQKDLVQKQTDHDTFSLVYYDPGSRACQLSQSIFEQLPTFLNNIPFYSIDVTRWPGQKQKNFFATYVGTPTWVYFKKGKRAYVITGYNDLVVYKEALAYMKSNRTGGDEH